MGGSVIQVESITTDLNRDYSDSLARALLDTDSGIDDPVNDTGVVLIVAI